MSVFLRKPVIILSAVALLLGGCARLTNTELLTSETWVLTDLTSEDADPTFLALAKALYSLEAYDYADNGTFSITYTDTAFTPDDGTWRFIDDETRMISQLSGEEPDTVDIVVLDKDNLSYIFKDFSGTYTFSFGPRE